MTTAILNYQPSLTLTETIAAIGIFPSRDSFNDGMTLGMFHTYGFIFGLAQAPAVNGQLLNISQNTALFSLLGTTYGGNGQTTFALPDLGGRSSVSGGQGPGLGDVFLGQQTGSASTLLLQSQLPPSAGGTSAPADDDQPELAVKYMIRSEGIFPSQGGGGSGRLDYIGSVVKFAGNFVPGGYLECNGQLLDIATYDVLFALIGTTYGGDGQTTFALPDLRGRHIVGAGGSYFLGEAFGQEDVAIGQVNLPAEMGGNGQPFDNREPSLALNYCIALGGLFPSQDGGADPYDAMIGEVIVFAGGFAPRGYALCAGQLLPINQNQALFSLLGTIYGGNGTTNFALPDLRGRTAIGSGNGFVAGQTVGTDQTVLTLDNIPDLNFSGTGNGENLYGGNGNDTINGLGGADTIKTNGGNDTLNGGDGDDTLNGGGGVDTASYAGAPAGVSVDLRTSAAQNTGGAGIDRLSLIENLTGSDFADTLYGETGWNVLDGGAGNDSFLGFEGNDTILGGLGNDAAYGGIGNDTMNGGGDDDSFLGEAGNDTLNGEDGIDRLYGGDDNDTLNGGAGNDIMEGGNGNDTVDGGTGNDNLRGNAGNDIFILDSNSDVVVELIGEGIDEARSSSSTTYLSANVENLLGTGLNQFLSGNNLDNIVSAGAGNDDLRGLDGNDTLNGNAGNDAAYGGTGNDTMNGGANDDSFLGEAGNDTLNGGDGLDRLYGGGDDDILNGNAGNDIMEGGTGNDTLDGGTGDDNMRGNDGNDIFFLDSAGDFAIELAGQGAADQVRSARAVEFLAAEVENLIGLLNGGQTLNGNGLANIILAGGGGDTIFGGGGGDNIRGGAGGDRIDGGLASDVLFGGTSTDPTGSGNDIFVEHGAAGYDGIYDFQGGAGAGDVVELKTIAGGGLHASAAAAFAALQQIGANVYLPVDADSGVSFVNRTIAQFSADDFFLVA